MCVPPLRQVTAVIRSDHTKERTAQFVETLLNDPALQKQARRAPCFAPRPAHVRSIHVVTTITENTEETTPGIVFFFKTSF